MDELYTLVESAQRGDRAAYGELVTRCQPIVYAKALARASMPLAEALGRITLGLCADADYFTTIAKLRAARRREPDDGMTG